jgi:hypothetical protein
MAQLFAYAVIHEDPPEVLAAEDLDVLHWRLAIDLVARTSARELQPEQVELLRAALVEERWADAVAEWIGITGVAVDVYTDLRVWSTAEAETAPLELQFTPLFAD